MWLYRLVQYLYGILMSFMSIMFFVQGGFGGFIGGIIVLVTSLFCIPVIREIFEKSYNCKVSRPVKFVVVIFGYICFYIFMDKDSTTNKNTLNQSTSTEIVSDSNTQKTIDSLSNVIAELENKNKDGENIAPLPIRAKGDHSSNTQYNNSTNSRKVSKKRGKAQRTGYGNSFYSGNSGYIRGRRGGCYYINSHGNKVYVDRSYCN